MQPPDSHVSSISTPKAYYVTEISTTPCSGVFANTIDLNLVKLCTPRWNLLTIMNVLCALKLDSDGSSLVIYYPVS